MLCLLGRDSSFRDTDACLWCCIHLCENSREAEIAERLQREYEEAIPDEIEEKVKALVEANISSLQQELESQFKANEEQLLSRITALEGGIAAS